MTIIVIAHQVNVLDEVGLFKEENLVNLQGKKVCLVNNTRPN
ncbi:hypothetical protein [Bacillus sp. OK048]|nr:hypothetical protein [Bacillus sp. OK048]